MQLFQCHILAPPVGGDLGDGTHAILLYHHGESGILTFTDRDWAGGHGGGGVGEQGIEQADGLFDPLIQRLIAATVGSEQQSLHILFRDWFGETGGNPQADQFHVV